MTVITSIIQSIRNAASYNRHELAAPRVILGLGDIMLRTLRRTGESMNAVLLDLGGQGLSVDSQDAGRFGLFPSGPLEHK